MSLALASGDQHDSDSSDNEIEEENDDPFVEMVRAQAQEEEEEEEEQQHQQVTAGGGSGAPAAAAVAAAAAATLPPPPPPAAGPNLAGRSHERDVQFREEACAAFVALGLHADSRLQKSQVLSRDPDVPSGGRDRCPRPLWALIKSHGGFIEAGRFGVSRTRILRQFNLWRVEQFSRAGGRLTPVISEEDLQAVLDQAVPSADALMTETAEYRRLYSSASKAAQCREKSSRLEVWRSDDCRSFWKAQRTRIINVLKDAAINHPDVDGYVESNTHTDDVYAELSGILARSNPSLAEELTISCDFCCVEVKGVSDCDCLDVVAEEAYDMYVGFLLRHVGAYSGGDGKAFSSPPLDAVVPFASAVALYNIAGALLLKASKQTRYVFFIHHLCMCMITAEKC